MLADTATSLWDTHSGELLILILFALLVVALVILVPQLLRANLRKSELGHAEHLKALEQGIPLDRPDDASVMAGRTALLVPMVAVISASTVTCFLVAYRSESIFSVALAAWAVAGIVSLAAITGGVALIGRIAQLRSGEEDEVPPPNPME
jgi:hypothetical protein